MDFFCQLLLTTFFFPFGSFHHHSGTVVYHHPKKNPDSQQLFTCTYIFLCLSLQLSFSHLFFFFLPFFYLSVCLSPLCLFSISLGQVVLKERVNEFDKHLMQITGAATQCFIFKVVCVFCHKATKAKAN